MAVAAELVVKNARLLDQTALVDIAIDGGRIVGVSTSECATPARRTIDAEAGLVTPSLVEAHYHPDKANTRIRLTESTGPGGWDAATAVKAGFTVEDVEARASEALRVAVSHGVGHMRAEVDVDSTVGLACFEGVKRASEQRAALIDVEIVAFPQEGIVRGPGAVPRLRQALSGGARVVGAWPNAEQTCFSCNDSSARTSPPWCKRSMPTTATAPTATTPRWRSSTRPGGPARR